MKDNPRSFILKLPIWTFRFILVCLLFYSINCNFETPSEFELPTWFVDIKFPLIHERYSLEGMVDSSNNIYQAADSGMQIIFTGDLPTTSIDASYLEVNFPKGYMEVSVPPEPVNGPDFDFPATIIDTSFSIPLVLYDSLLYVDTTGIPFSMPPDSERTMTAEMWNTQIANLFNDAFQPIQLRMQVFNKNDIVLPTDPALIEAIEALVIQENPASYFSTTLRNIGIAKPIIDTNIDFKTGDSLPLDDTLAVHDENQSITKNISYTDSSSLSNARLRSWIEMNIDFAIETEAEPNHVTIAANDSLTVDIRLLISIPGVDSVDVTIDRIDLSPELPTIAFPSDIEIYKGVFAGGVPPDTNFLDVDLLSNYPFKIDFLMDFKNFKPAAIIDTTLRKGIPHNFSFDLKDDTLSSSGYPSQPITELELDVSAVIDSQLATLALDGSSLGDFSMDVRMYNLKFRKLELTLTEEFPPTQQDLEGMPQGFTGMAFTDVKIEFTMLNQIQLPVDLDIDIVGINTFGDSLPLSIRTLIKSPENEFDTSKTVIRLMRGGTATMTYDSPISIVWTDSTFDSTETNETDIVGLLSFNPATMYVDAAAQIDGRGDIVVGASIGGSYRLIAPFEVRMDPMTFIPVTKTPIDEMDHGTRNRIRSSLYQTILTANVINSIPVGGEISILMSNKTLFPLDTTAAMLSVFRDSMVVQEGWLPTDSLYIITNCEAINPEMGNIYIFDVMDDYRNCIDGLVYLVRSTYSGVDTVISYVDTLIQIILPDPLELYADTSTTGHPGAVAVPGELYSISTIDTNRIFLLTDYGDHYVVPRFHLNGTDGQRVYISMSDYIDIQSTITFRISSTGMLEEPPDELVVLYPNGGEELKEGDKYTILWKTFGNIKKIDLHYAIGSTPNDDDWTPIWTEITNEDSVAWIPLGIVEPSQTERDSVRIRIADTNSDVEDVSGWYFKIIPSSRGSSSTTTESESEQSSQSDGR